MKRHNDNQYLKSKNDRKKTVKLSSRDQTWKQKFFLANNFKLFLLFLELLMVQEFHIIFDSHPDHANNLNILTKIRAT